MIVDTHCHLYFDRFDDDRNEVVARMREAGVCGAVAIGIDAKTNAQAHELAQQHSFIRYSVGMHPTSPFPPHFDAPAFLLPWWEKDVKPVAIGECGIDLHWDTNPLEAQQDVFRQQLALAKELDVPVIIHTRDANDETEAVLRRHGGGKGVLHCFNGSELLLQFALDKGWFVSFAGNMTFPKAQEIRDAAIKVPLDRLLVETDAPFLAPQPVRGKRCEPAHTIHTARALAELRGMEEAAMHDVLLANSRECFGVEWQ